MHIHFEKGTLRVEAAEQAAINNLAFLTWDTRVKAFRAHALYYRQLIAYLTKNKIPFDDQAKAYNQLALQLSTSLKSRVYQNEALVEWMIKKRGVVVLPTGTGKSFFAMLVMQQIQRSTLIVVPTIDLLEQWHQKLKETFDSEIGMIGGGHYRLLDTTVITYDSARIYAHQLGNRFCLIIFDECHHLPAQGYAEMARAFLAPYRLGLTATPVEDEEKTLLNQELCGSIVYQKDISDLSGEFLASYSVKRILVQLSDEERALYEYHREFYTDVRKSITPYLYGQFKWEDFVLKASTTVKGRRALKSFMIQKQIALSAQMKMEKLSEILIEHSRERILIFTNDNKTALQISCLFFLPLITHETKSKERKIILQHFRENRWPYLVSSRVLNEGIDLPEANIAVIISGSGVVREHVQRLGRILRQKEGKRAILYELITENTSEEISSQKRRQHNAYALFH